MFRWSAALLFVLAASCEETEEESEVAATVEEAPPAKPAEHVIRRLVDDVWRAEVFIDDTRVIEPGTADGSKYGGLSFTDTVGGYASVGVEASGSGALRVEIDGRLAGTAELSAQTPFHRFDLTKPIAPGHHTLGIQGGQIDRLLLGAGRPEPGPRAEVRSHEGSKQSIVGDGVRRTAFYVQAMARTRLVFDCGADEATLFEVRATADGAQTETLFSRAVDQDDWVSGEVDLHPFRGHAIRNRSGDRG